ncbi:MAG TPA: hypothetical protein VIM79_05965 [Niastella sp.]
MKKIFTLIAVLFSITTFAAEYPGPKTSKISFTNSDRSTMQVRIDGAMYDLGSSMALENIKPGNHSIVIYKTMLAGFRKRTQVIYNSTMFINGGQLVTFNINRGGQVMVATSSMDKFDRNDRYSGNDRYNNGNDRYNNGRYDNNSNNNDRNSRDNNYGRH